MTLSPADGGLPSTRTARSTLLHLFGDLVHPSRAAVPTAALLGALGDMGHEVAAGRQALLRSARSGWIRSERRGRETWWAITEQGRGVIGDGLRRVADLGVEDADWDGRWLVLLTSIPHERRAIRDRVYRYLSWSGFGMAATGLWVSPNLANEVGARFAITHFGLASSTASFVGTPAGIGMTESELVRRAWNLEGLDDRYEKLVRRLRGHEAASGREALRAVLTLDADLRSLPLVDPRLPARLTPDRSGRVRAQELLAMRSRWLVDARDYWNATCQPLVRTTPD